MKKLLAICCAGALLFLTGCATKNKNDLQKSPCAGPCFETTKKV